MTGLSRKFKGSLRKPKPRTLVHMVEQLMWMGRHTLSTSDQASCPHLDSSGTISPLKVDAE